MSDEMKFPVITLCGSTKFRKQFEDVMRDLTLNGWCVLSVGCFGHSDKNPDDIWDNKDMLDEMHKQKIDMAEAVYIINIGGYVGASTQREIEYAESHGKKVMYLCSTE